MAKQKNQFDPLIIEQYSQLNDTEKSTLLNVHKKTIIPLLVIGVVQIAFVLFAGISLLLTIVPAFSLGLVGLIGAIPEILIYIVVLILSQLMLTVGEKITEAIVKSKHPFYSTKLGAYSLYLNRQNKNNK